jgi:hypothetical protein
MSFPSHSFLHSTNDCVVFRRQIQSTINEDRLRFQEVKIDRPPVPVATLELTSKKVLVRSCAADKSKDKDIVIGDPRMPNMSCRVVTWKDQDKRKTGDAGGKYNRTPDHGHMSCVCQMVQTLRPDSSGQVQTVLAMKVGQSVDDQKQQRPQTVIPQHPKTGTRKQNTSKTSGRLHRVGPAFDQLIAKYMKKDVPHIRPIKQTKSKGDLCESKGRLNQPKKWCNQDGLVILLQGCHGAFWSIHCRCVVLPKCGAVQRLIHIIGPICLLIRARGTISFCLLTY